MYRNVNLDAHISALLFLGSAGLLALLLLGIVVLAIWRRPWVRYALTGLAVLTIGYSVLLFCFSLFSQEHTLARGEEKYFCELDCHLAYSVQNAERLKTIGSATADGEFYVVKVRTRFDESTTAPWRPRDVALTPNPLEFFLVDQAGEALHASTTGQRAWETMHSGDHSPLDPLRPGDSYDTTLVFDVPAGTTSPRLLASFAVFPTQVLIGDENSVLHKKTYFAL